MSLVHSPESGRTQVVDSLRDHYERSNKLKLEMPMPNKPLREVDIDKCLFLHIEFHNNGVSRQQLRAAIDYWWDVWQQHRHCSWSRVSHCFFLRAVQPKRQTHVSVALWSPWEGHCTISEQSFFNLKSSCQNENWTEIPFSCNWDKGQYGIL